jgi:WD40 repeat protein
MTDFRFREALLCESSSTAVMKFSPDSRFIAVLSREAGLDVISCLSLETASTIECPGGIASFSWSPDSKLLLALIRSKNAIQVYFAEKARTIANHLTQCYAGISGGHCDIEHIVWAPNSAAVVLVAHAAIQVFVWDLKSKAVRKLVAPKNVQTSVAFSPDQSTLAVLGRENGRDILALFDGGTFQHRGSIVLRTLDSSIVKWSPDSLNVLVIDAISQHLLEIVNVKTQRTFQHSAYDGYLGISEASFCPNAKIVAVGGFDDYVRLLVAPEWKVLAEFLHETTIQGESVGVFSEDHDQFLPAEIPFELPHASSSGITQIKWAIGNRLLAIVSARTPTTVFLWNTETVSLAAVIVCEADVVQIDWSPVDEVLAVATGAGFVALWSPAEVNYVKPQEKVRVLAFEWRSDGRQLAVIDSEAGTYALADLYG